MTGTHVIIIFVTVVTLLALYVFYMLAAFIVGGGVFYFIGASLKARDIL